jgi:hypothetical protein
MSTTNWSKGIDADKENWMPQPYVYPGPSWECNFEHGLQDFYHTPHHFFTIPDGNGGQELAPFICYHIKDPSPFLEACMGFNCDVFSHPLHVHPDREYHAPLTPHQEWFFEPDQKHTTIISWALHNKRDPMLTAEVHCTHYFCCEYKKAADDLVQFRATMDGYKYQYKHSLQHIVRADRYHWLWRSIKSTLILENGRMGGLTATEILDGKRFVQQARIANDCCIMDRCCWCDQHGYLAH